VALGDTVAGGPSGCDARDPGVAPSRLRPTTFRGQRQFFSRWAPIAAPSSMFRALGATATPVTISFANRLIECLFAENAL